MIKKELKQYTVRKTVRLSCQVMAYSAKQAVAMAEFPFITRIDETTKGWWCRKNRK